VLKIATFNINNVRSGLPNLLDWLTSAEPDIVCLQELKTAHNDLPLGPIQDAGYHAVWKGEKTWNGVAILSRNADPIVTALGAGNLVADLTSRSTKPMPASSD
jgi:exodeoxyribonuclease III